MPKLRVHNFSVALDGYAAGPDQSLDNPLGVGGMELHNSAFGTRTFHKIFHFVTDGIEAALERAHAAADGQDVRLAGGVSAIQQYLRAGLVDEMHLAYAPLLLGSGERPWDDLDRAPSGYEIAEFVGTPAARHVRLCGRANAPGPSAWARQGTM